MSEDAGTRFGRYRLLRTIASDAVSTTYFATTDGGRQRGRTSSVEHYVLRIAAAVDPGDEQAVDAARQYLSEAQRAGIVDHPTLVRPHDLGIIDDRPFVAHPFIRAVPLGELLAHGGAINQTAALAMFAQLAAALDAAHRAGVVHGALSPRTIWVGPSVGEGAAYVAYLTGFGTATLLRHHMEQAPPGPPVEDVLYVAPEQLRGEPVTGHSDQYALACAVYHTLAGRPPFERETRAKLYGAHLLAPAPELAAQDPVAAPASAALLRAMSKTPEERYDTCGELVHEALPADAPAPARTRAPLRRRRAIAAGGALSGGRRRWWLLAVAALVVVAAGAAVWTLVRPAGAGGAAERTPASPTEGRPITRPRMTAASTARRIAWDVPVATRPVRQIEVLDGAAVVRTDGGLVGADIADGAVLWRRDVRGIAGVVADRRLVAIGGPEPTVIDVDSGDRRWTAAGAGPVRALALTDEAVVVAGGDRSAPRLTAVARQDGRRLWRSERQRAGAQEGGSERERPLAVAAGDDVAFALIDDALVGVELAQPESARGRVRPTWRTRVAAWPVLAAVGDAVIVATEEGQVCRHAADDGAVRWCETIPGVGSQAPRLFADAGSVIAATPEVVVGLDARSGQQVWSVSPGSPTNQVVADATRVVIADTTGLRVLEADTGDAVLELPALGNVTALAVAGGRLYVGSAEGGLMSLDLAAPG